MSARVALISFWRHGNPLNPVGASLLAMAECQPISMLDVPASSRASSLPQVSVTPANACHTTKQGGSELARDGGVSAGINAGRADLIAIKLAPTGFSGAHKCLSHHKTRVGASLLAMAECQPISMLDVPVSSRASSLPQDTTAGFALRRYTPKHDFCYE